MSFQQADFNELSKPTRKRYISVLFFVFLAIGLIYGFTRFGIGANEIEVSSDDETFWGKVSNLFTVSSERNITLDNDPDYSIPKPEKDRWDILILGIRGEDDENAEEAGAMLTDTIMILSYEKTSQKTSLVSIPRDLFVRITNDKTDKINSAYEIGALNNGGISFAKKIFSRITGIYIDNVIVLDFSSFKQIIDDLGGIDVELDKPFMEKQQWGYEFNLPAGINHLDGPTTLYYARSRFSTSDFDRAQRQQKIILAVKDKISELSLLSDPIKTLSILKTIHNNIETDLKLWDAGSLLDLAKEFNNSGDKIRRYLITTENLVYEGHINNLYVLLPQGDNLQGIKNLFQEILQ